MSLFYHLFMKPTFKLAMIADLDLLLKLMQQFYEFEKIPFNTKIANAMSEILQNEQYGRV